MELEHAPRNRNQFGSAGAAARLCVEQRRLACESGRTGPPLFVDVGPQVLVLRDRHALAEAERIVRIRKPVLDAEARVLIAREQPGERSALRAIRRGSRAIEGVPEQRAVGAHRRRERDFAHARYLENGAPSSRRNDFG